MTSIDLNSDLGEGFGVWSLTDDDALLDTVTSANVACGFHAADASTMRRVCDRAAANGVAIGAHVGYRDLAGFGRRRIEVDPAELRDEVLYQLGALAGVARAAGSRVSHVKPHGAMYHAVVRDEGQADAVVAAVASYDPGLSVVGLPGSHLLRSAAAAGLDAVPEAFADRAYLPDGSLVPRRDPRAVLDRPDEIVARCVELATTGTLRAVEGSVLEVEARSICVHGDTPGAVEIAGAVRRALSDAGVAVESFRHAVGAG